MSCPDWVQVYSLTAFEWALFTANAIRNFDIFDQESKAFWRILPI
jgi:hypothetical protein